MNIDFPADILTVSGRDTQHLGRFPATSIEGVWWKNFSLVSGASSRWSALSPRWTKLLLMHPWPWQRTPQRESFFPSTQSVWWENLIDFLVAASFTFAIVFNVIWWAQALSHNLTMCSFFPRPLKKYLEALCCFFPLAINPDATEILHFFFFFFLKPYKYLKMNSLQPYMFSWNLSLLIVLIKREKNDCVLMASSHSSMLAGFLALLLQLLWLHL